MIQGVQLLAASDSPNTGIIPAIGLHKELELLVEGGFSPAEALRLATVNPARFLRIDTAGQVKEGFLADLLILNENPIENIANTMDINGVVSHGLYFDRTETEQNDFKTRGINKKTGSQQTLKMNMRTELFNMIR